MAIETYVIYYLYNWINIYYKYWGAVLYYTASHCVTLHWIYVKSHHSTTLSSITSHTSLHVTYISVYVCVSVCSRWWLYALKSTGGGHCGQMPQEQRRAFRGPWGLSVWRLECGCVWDWVYLQDASFSDADDRPNVGIYIASIGLLWFIQFWVTYSEDNWWGCTLLWTHLVR